MNIDIKIIYESSSTDGYTSVGDGVYFTTEESARKFGKMKHGNYACIPLNHYILMVDGCNYLLKSKDTIKLNDATSNKDIEVVEKFHKVEVAKSKLTDEEIKLLGLD